MIDLEIPIAIPDIYTMIPSRDSISLTRDLSRYPRLGAKLYRMRKSVMIYTWQTLYNGEWVVGLMDGYETRLDSRRDSLHEIVAEFNWDR